MTVGSTFGIGRLAVHISKWLKIVTILMY